MTTIRNDARTDAARTANTPKAAPATTSTPAGTEAMPMATTTTTTTTATTTKRLPADELSRLTKAIDAASAKGSLNDDGRLALRLDLARLPAADFRALMADPVRAQNLLAAFDGDDRAQLLDLLVQKGAVSAQPGATTTTTSPHAPVPPQAPALLRDDANAAPALRRAILDENLARVADHKARYADYRDAYHHAVEHARDVGALRDLGPLAALSLPSNLPGAPLSSDANRAYLDARGRTDDDRATTQLVADRFRRLSGREVAGMSFSGESEVSFKLESHEGPMVEVGFHREATVGPDGDVEKGFGVSGKAGLEHAAATVDHDGVGLELEVHGNGVAVSDEGVELKGHFEGIAGKAGFGGDRMSFGVGAETEFKLAGLDAKLEVGGSVGLQGVTAEDRAMFVSTSTVGFFDTPPELLRGKAWSSLPAVVRADYELQGWTAAEWTKKADLARFARRAA